MEASCEPPTLELQDTSQHLPRCALWDSVHEGNAPVKPFVARLLVPNILEQILRCLLIGAILIPKHYKRFRPFTSIKIWHSNHCYIFVVWVAKQEIFDLRRRNTKSFDLNAMNRISRR